MTKYLPATSKYVHSHFPLTFSFGDHYEWNKVTSCIHNILSGQRWIEHYGEISIINSNSEKCQCKVTFIKVSCLCFLPIHSEMFHFLIFLRSLYTNVLYQMLLWFKPATFHHLKSFTPSRTTGQALPRGEGKTKRDQTGDQLGQRRARSQQETGQNENLQKSDNYSWFIPLRFIKLTVWLKSDICWRSPPSDLAVKCHGSL